MRDIVEKYQHYMAEAARLQNLAEEQAAYIAELETALIELAEEGKVNPWAVCSAKVGRGDKAKYESCVMDIKASGRADLGEERGRLALRGEWDEYAAKNNAYTSGELEAQTGTEPSGEQTPQKPTKKEMKKIGKIWRKLTR
jgi:hypothetical protein